LSLDQANRVTALQPKSEAQAGLIQTNDVVVALDGMALSTTMTLERALQAQFVQEGDNVTLTILRPVRIRTACDKQSKQNLRPSRVEQAPDASSASSTTDISVLNWSKDENGANRRIFDQQSGLMLSDEYYASGSW